MTLTDRLATLLIQSILRAEMLAVALEEAQAKLSALELKPASETQPDS